MCSKKKKKWLKNTEASKEEIQEEKVTSHNSHIFCNTLHEHNIEETPNFEDSISKP